MESFSVRNGLVSNTLVMDEIPQQARIRLYNFFYNTVKAVSKVYSRHGETFPTEEKEKENLKHLWMNLFYWSVSAMPYDTYKIFYKIEEFFQTAVWYDIYSRLENFLVFLRIDKKSIYLDNLIRILNEERLGYQLLEINGEFQFVQLSNSLEVAEIEKSTERERE